MIALLDVVDIADEELRDLHIRDPVRDVRKMQRNKVRSRVSQHLLDLLLRLLGLLTGEAYTPIVIRDIAKLPVQRAQQSGSQGDADHDQRAAAGHTHHRYDHAAKITADIQEDQSGIQ